MFSGVQASTRLVHACSPACKPARGSCTHVLRRACQHKAHARMQSRVLACTPEVPARREFERYADQRLWQGDSVTHCETRADGRHHQLKLKYHPSIRSIDRANSYDLQLL